MNLSVAVTSVIYVCAFESKKQGVIVTGGCAETAEARSCSSLLREMSA